MRYYKYLSADRTILALATYIITYSKHKTDIGIYRNTYYTDWIEITKEDYEKELLRLL